MRYETPIIAELILALVIVSALATPASQRVRLRKNHAPRIQSFTSSQKMFFYCPFVPCTASGATITLEAKANDPDNDSLMYKYSVSIGTIVGSGPVVTWDLTRARIGKQTATVEVIDQRGGKALGIAQVDVVECGACDPACPTLSVTCPTNVIEGGIVDFDATVSGADPAQKLTYLWSHSNGKRIAGQGANLKIKAVGSPGDVITATVRVLGFDPACSYQASCESTISKCLP